VKDWLSRATASTVRRGEGRTPAVRWSRWFPRASPVDDNLFQGSEDPYPDHWRQSPEPWPPGLAGEDGARQELRNALGDLPPTWRAVISSRDMAGRNGGAAASWALLPARSG
jgi:RNA polymerase sigma-70 factor (ECF subfamily)